MKLICSNDFFNTPVFGIKRNLKEKESDELFQHENHVHVGYRFTIGGDTPYDQLQTQQKEMVGLLLKHKLAVIDDESNEKLGIIAKIDNAAAVALKTRKNDVQAAKNAAAVSMPAVLKQLAEAVTLLSQLTAKKG